MPYAIIEGKTCFYQDIGNGYPILLGHSYLWTSEMWKPQLKELAKEFRCIAVDLWSHGQSGSLNNHSYCIEQVAHDYWKLMEHLKIAEFAVVGLSVGGMWGTHLALSHPNAVNSLVLMDTFVGAEPEITKEKYFKMLNLIESAGCFTKNLLDQIVPLFFSPYTLIHQKQLVDEFRNDLVSLKKERIPDIVTLGRAIFSRRCLLKQLSFLSQPTLVLAGQDDIPRPPSEAEEMTWYLPNAEMHIIPHAGHISNLEQPTYVNSVLVNFLRKNLKPP